MNWEVIIPTVISIIAGCVAISSKRQAAKASGENIRIQKRMEVNQFYPIIDLDVNLKNNQPSLKINNKSDINSASSYTVKFVLRVSAKDMNIDLEGEATGNEVAKNSSEIISPEIINTYLADAMPFIKRTSEEKLHIVLRFWVQYKAAHPDSMPMSDEIVVYITNHNGQLALKNT